MQSIRSLQNRVFTRTFRQFIGRHQHTFWTALVLGFASCSASAYCDYSGDGSFVTCYPDPDGKEFFDSLEARNPRPPARYPASRDDSSVRMAKPPADKNDKPDNCGGNPTGSNPVILASGEKYEVHHDFITGNVHGIALDRTYHSFGTSTSMFGPKWSSGYE